MLFADAQVEIVPSAENEIRMANPAVWGGIGHKTDTFGAQPPDRGVDAQ